MARAGLPNYRKLAFATYPHVCVWCGFATEAVLQVAHVDCNPVNCDAARKAVEKKRQNPEALREAAYKAVATRKARIAATK